MDGYLDSGADAGLSATLRWGVPGRFSLRLLGPFELLDREGRSLSLRGRKVRALLGRLALARGKPLRRDALATLLWEAKSENDARCSLRQALSELRRAFGKETLSVLRVDDHEVALQLDQMAVDAHELERLCASPTPVALDRVTALAPLRLLDDLDDLTVPMTEWLISERERLNERTLIGLERWLDSTVEADSTDRHGMAIARTLLAIEPAHEPAHRFIMRSHAARGDTAAALRQFESCRRELERRLDAKPSQSTLDLAQTIRRGGSAGATPPARPIPVLVRKLSQAQKPSVVVLPFHDPEGPRSSPTAECVHTELTNALSRFKFIRLMSTALGLQDTSSSQTRDGLGERRGAQYAVTGVIHRRHSTRRVMLSLIECATGSALVTESRDLPDEPDSASGRLLPGPTISSFIMEVLANEIRRAFAEPADDDAVNLTLRAIPAFFELDPKRLDDARALLDRALALDPSFGYALAFQSFNRIIRLRPCSPDERAELLGGALELSGRAVELDPRDSLALSFYAHARVLNREHDEAFDLQRRAIAANPLNPQVFARHSVVLCLMGEHEAGLQAFDHYMAFNPLDPFRRYFGGVKSMISMLAGKYEESVAAGRETMADQPQLGSGYRSTIAALGHLGRIDEARPLVKRLLELEPGFEVERYVGTFPLRREEDRRRLAEGMLLAGLR